MDFYVGLRSLIWSWRWERCPLTPLGALLPRPAVSSIINLRKCDQFMRPGATAGMECLFARGEESTGESLSRGMLRFEALEVGVRREVVLVDA